jgi:hypothetical protein
MTALSASAAARAVSDAARAALVLANRVKLEVWLAAPA